MDRAGAARAFAVASGVPAVASPGGCGERRGLRPLASGQPDRDAGAPADGVGSDGRDATSVVDRIPDVVRPGSACEDWPVPEGRFDLVSSGNGSSCGIRADGTVACWGHLVYPRAAVP